MHSAFSLKKRNFAARLVQMALEKKIRIKLRLQVIHYRWRCCAKKTFQKGPQKLDRQKTFFSVCFFIKDAPSYSITFMPVYIS